MILASRKGREDESVQVGGGNISDLNSHASSIANLNAAQLQTTEAIISGLSRKSYIRG